MITIYLKHMSGDMTAWEVEETTTLSTLLEYVTANYPTEYPRNSTHLLRGEEDREEIPLMDQEMVTVFFQKRVRQILNRTEGTYFCYKENYENTFLSLFEKQRDGTSRWRRSDEIVFVPETVPLEYIEGTYEAVDVSCR